MRRGEGWAKGAFGLRPEKPRQLMQHYSQLTVLPFPLPFSLPASSIAAVLFLPPFVEQDGEDDDYALGDILPEGRQAENGQTVVHHADNQRADHRSPDRADATAQAGTAEHDGGNRIQFVTNPPVAVGRV